MIAGDDFICPIAVGLQTQAVPDLPPTDIATLKSGFQNLPNELSPRLRNSLVNRFAFRTRSEALEPKKVSLAAASIPVEATAVSPVSRELLRFKVLSTFNFARRYVSLFCQNRLRSERTNERKKKWCHIAITQIEDSSNRQQCFPSIEAGQGVTYAAGRP